MADQGRPPRDDLGRHEDTFDWRYVTRVFRALRYRFTVRVTDPALGAAVDELYGALATDGSAEHRYSLGDRGDEAASRRYLLFRDGARIFSDDDRGEVITYLLWDANRRAIESSNELILIHASAAERSGRALLLPAPAEAGKTTLVTGLVRRGFGYITDEAVAIDPATRMVEPYPKPLAIEVGSQQALADLAPADPIASNGTWHLAPDAIRPGAVAPVSTPALIVFPRYRAGATTTVRPMSRAAALRALGESVFNLGYHGAAGFHSLADIVRSCRCFRLESGDLAEACAAVEALTPDGA